ncbi:antibiotic biosynthesis monooxygenase [Leptolyngbya sp. 15MV]|nr:antibiotic biosynthesis monooxygenase [Leptolyngbya sp. 15MV]
MTKREMVAALLTTRLIGAAKAEERVAGQAITAVLVLRGKPGREAEFPDLLAPVLDAMRHEPTFINAILHRDPEDPTRFLLYETWADRTDLVEVQMRRPYRNAYWARLPELLAAPREVGVWTPIRADFGPNATTRSP